MQKQQWKYLSHFTERDRFANSDNKYAWKGYDFAVLNQQKYNVADW